MESSRWKCPDCKGWVSASVQVHYCSQKDTTVPWASYSPGYPGVLNTTPVYYTTCKV